MELIMLSEQDYVRIRKALYHAESPSVHTEHGQTVYKSVVLDILDDYVEHRTSVVDRDRVEEV